MRLRGTGDVPTIVRRLLLLLSLTGLASCGQQSSDGRARPAADLTGAWRAKIHFQSGAFAPFQDLEFMYVLNEGGTMTESSNYDGAPPVPPAYGLWRSSAPNEYELHYEFYITKPPASFGDITRGGGWAPAGRGIVHERITLSADGNRYTSVIRYAALDTAGNPAEGGGEGTTEGVRIIF